MSSVSALIFFVSIYNSKGNVLTPTLEFLCAVKHGTAQTGLNRTWSQAYGLGVQLCCGLKDAHFHFSAGADCQWLDALRARQIASNTSLQRSQSNPILGSQFFPYFNDQDSYAAAVRRTQVPLKYQQITPINQSRSSSPTQYGLTRNFSSLHLNSRDSGFSSLTTDSSSERAQYSGRSRNKYDRGSVSLSSSPRGRYSGKSQHSTPSRERYSRKFYGIHQSTLNAHQSPDFRRSPHDRHQPRAIPGMPLHPETDSGASEEESKVSEGGWTRVNYRKKPHRPSPAKTSRERARGSHRGRRTF